MSVQATDYYKREHAAGGYELTQKLLDSLPKWGEVAIDPANLGAGAVAETTVALPAGTVPAAEVASAMVFVQPPNTLETGLVCVSARITAADTLGVTLYNPTAGAINGASRLWTWCVMRGKRLSSL